MYLLNFGVLILYCLGVLCFSAPALSMVLSFVVLFFIRRWWLLLFFALGFGLFHFYTTHRVSLSESYPQKVDAVFTLQKPFFNPSQRRVLATDLKGNRFYLTFSDAPALGYGDVIRVQGRFIFPEPIRNPGQFDYRKYLIYKNITGLVKVRSYEKVGSKFLNPFKRVAYFLKQKILDLHVLSLSSPYFDLFIGLVFGDDGVRLPEDMEEQFRKTGLMHLLVVSGSQVSLLTGIAFHFFQFFGFRSVRLLGVLVLTNIIFYFLTGGGASILRAIVMNIAVVSAKTFYYRTTPIHIVSLSLFLMVLVDPFLLFDVGAQLSFLATLALIYGVDIVEKVIPDRCPRFLKTSLAVAIAPFVFTTPLTWGIFREVSLVSILSNLLVVEAIEVLVVVGFVSTIIGLFLPWFTYFMNQTCLVVMKGMVWVVDVLSGLPGVAIKLPSSWSFVLSLYGAIFLSVWVLNLKKKEYLKWIWGVVLLVGVLVSWPQQGRLVVTYLDVGQGDSTVIQTPGGYTILVDAGVVKMGERVVIPFLRSQNITDIDMAIVTHYDLDHVGGFLPVVRSEDIKRFVDNGHESAYVGTVIEGEHMVIRSYQTYEFPDGVRVTFFHPDRNRRTSEENESSVVFKLTYGEVDFMFTGDLEVDGEYWLVRNYMEDLGAEVLKLGHHGSKTSTTAPFLSAVDPQMVVVSAGRFNRFGHPSEAVLSRIDVPLYRTDRSGAVTVESDGNSLWIRTML